MSEPKDEPAFAAIATSPAGDVYHQTGMTMRDWFAGQAIMGLCADPSNHKLFDGPDEAAANAYLIADAMLAERSRAAASSQAEIERLKALLKSARSYVSDVASNNSAFLQEEAGHDLARIDAALSGSAK